MLFMLVATIAATATYKWITSEGSTSASRMMQREAYQSALAGIEDARAWITFHGNDMGALVKQYRDNIDKYKQVYPISLDTLLHPSMRAGAAQKYHVWITDMEVDTAMHRVKLKLLSSGESRNGSVHNEVALLNVDGLYQVKLPRVQRVSHINFDFAYYGGSYKSSGPVTMTSGVVNGNWNGNPPTVERNWIVTGNATLSGSNLTVGATTCIGGNASIQNNGITTTDIYVGGNFKGVLNASGNAYFNGDADCENGSMRIGGNMTVNGYYQTNQAAGGYSTRVTGNLCVDSVGAIISEGTNVVFQVNGNVWMPGPQNLWFGSFESTGSGRRLVSSSDNQNTYNKIILGDSASTVYIAGAISSSTYNSTKANYSITETKSKKYCPTPISSNDEWSIREYSGGGESGDILYPSSTKNICGTWGTPHWEDWSPSAYYVLYTRNWQDWSYNTYKPYSSVTAAADKYAIYYTGGVTDVRFGSYNLSNWYVLNNWVTDQQRQIRLDHARDDYGRGTNPVYRVFKPSTSSDQMPWKFTSPVAVGGYLVGGDSIFYNVGTGVYKGYNYDISAGKATGSPYCKKGSDQYRPVCGVMPWFKSDGTVTSVMDERTFACAESVMEDCYEIWEPSANGCDGSQYIVEDPLETCHNDYEPYAHVGCAANITTWGQNGFETALNNCYSQTVQDPALRESNLYNGYLVVHITGSSPGYNYNPSTSTPLNGKFIIIVDNRVKAQNGFPRTTSDTKVFMMLNDGSDKIQGVLEHYFIYTKKNTGTSDQLKLTGTLYSPASLCVTNNFQSSTLTFDQALVDDLSAAGIISSDGCGAGGSGGEGGSESSHLEIQDGGNDPYFIAMSPQLGVTVETQYEARGEDLPSADDAAKMKPTQSFIVLPRIIYLPRNPYGELKDYFSVVPLNGSELIRENVGTPVCAAGLPASGSLFARPSGGVLLNEGVYRCVASASGHPDVPFWVVVSGMLGQTPQVWFTEDAHEMPTTGSAQVEVDYEDLSGAGNGTVTIHVFMPSSVPAGWTVTPINPVGDGCPNSICSFTISGNGPTALFDVTTASASNGSITFQLIGDSTYALASPWSSTFYMSNVATINRVNPSEEEIDDYCSSAPDDCPEVGHRSASEWPDCITDSSWVKPSGGGPVIIDTNNSWTVAAGTSNLTLVPDRDIHEACVVIIPGYGDSTFIPGPVVANTSYYLKAIAKARKSSVKVGFKGDVGDGKNPHLLIDADTRSLTCYYNDVKDSVPKACTMDLYNGETVRISIAKSDGQNDNFNYWRCENNGGNTCPTTDPISSATYNSFTIKDNLAIIYAHFGEVDEHCFFDEFKQGGVRCNASNSKYCIDKCGNGASDVCPSAIEGGGYTNSKWHLVEGALGDIEDTYESISIDNAASRGSNRANRSAVKVMSTVQAGIHGTLKALVQLPKATSSYGKTSANIAKSGLMLRSNATGTEFLMLNVFVNNSGKLEARLCPNAGTENCLDSIPKNHGASLSVTPSSMVMVEAQLTDTNTLELTVFSGNYYGTPDTYTTSFKLNSLPNSYNDRTHEYVGFSMADPNFKIYGIGWSSDDYGADGCWDTYPTVKCSFAAKAEQGVIPLNTTVQPWVGHSGWFDSKSCTPAYYYDNGTDACGGHSGSETACSNDGYVFSSDGAGQHGYRDNNGVDVKAAKAWLNCLTNDDQAVAWAAGTNRAHCGMFWTGEFSECTNHENLGTISSISSGGGIEMITLTGTVNLRASKLNVTLENPNSSEVEVWLLSENAAWGESGFASNSVKFTGSSASFDVVETLAEGAQGFDPEHVKQVVVKNPGAYSVTNVSVTSTCKNAVGISNCQVSYNTADGRWEVTADVSNKSKVSGYSVTGRVGSSDVVTSTAAPSFSEDHATWNISHNPYASYQGSTFDFTASVTNASGETISTTCEPPVTIGSITCSNPASSNIASGAAWPAFTFKLNDCPQNSCDYDIYFDGSILSGNDACAQGSCSGSGSGQQSRTKSGNAEECNTDGGCSHTYEVRSSNAEKNFDPCEVSFIVQKKVTTEITATCSVGGSLYQGQGLQLNVSNLTNVNNQVAMTWSLNGSTQTLQCNSGGCWDNAMNAPTTPGTYSYTLTYSGNEVCSGTVVIEPALTCNVNPTTLNKGDNYTFTGSNNVNCWSCTYTYDSGSEGNHNPTDAITKAASTTGTKTLTLSCTCNNSITATCSKDITINQAPPAFQCETNKSAPVSTSIALTPQNLSGCEDGCSYTIAGTSVTGNGYTSGALPSFTGPSNAGTQTYTVSLTNSANTTSHDCSVTWTAVSSSSSAPASSSAGGGCHCTDYCDAGCNNIELASGDYNSSAENRCVFFASATKLNFGDHSSKYLYLNGKKFDYNMNEVCNSASTCESWLASNVPSTADGGYYMYLPGSYNYASVTISGFDPCATVTSPTITACPVASATVSTGGKVKITPTTTNCNVMGGCDYTILPDGTGDKTGKYYSGNITFTGESTPGTVNYTIAISNSAGAAPSTCAFSVEYKVPEVTTIALGQTKSIKCGDSFKTNITCSNNCAKVKCNGNFSKTVTGSVSGPKTEGQYNDVQFINGWANTATINETFSTECADDKTLSCSASCGC